VIYPENIGTIFQNLNLPQGFTGVFAIADNRIIAYRFAHDHMSTATLSPFIESLNGLSFAAGAPFIAKHPDPAFYIMGRSLAQQYFIAAIVEQGIPPSQTELFLNHATILFLKLQRKSLLELHFGADIVRRNFLRNAEVSL